MQDQLEPMFVSIADAARFTSESQWTVKAKLRRGIYRARKSGRRTLIEFASVKQHMAALPAAKFTPPLVRQPSRQSGAREAMTK